MRELWTPESIKALLDRNNVAVERAVVAIYQRQTDDEQDAETTRYRNGRGFASCHAHLGSYYAKWILDGRHLDGKHLEKARRMMHCYAGQLCHVVQSRNPATASTAERETVHA